MGSTQSGVVPLAAYLLGRCGTGLLGFGLIALVSLYAYTGPPVKLKYRALGELLCAAVFGPALMLGAAYAQTGRLETVVLFPSMAAGALVAAILTGNNLRDRTEDRQAGIVTLAHVAGGRLARGLYLGTIALMPAALAVAGLTGAGPRLLVATPLTFPLISRPARTVWTGRRLPDIDAATARFVTAVLAVMFAAYLVEGHA